MAIRKYDQHYAETMLGGAEDRHAISKVTSTFQPSATLQRRCRPYVFENRDHHLLVSVPSHRSSTHRVQVPAPAPRPESQVMGREFGRHHVPPKLLRTKMAAQIGADVARLLFIPCLPALRGCQPHRAWRSSRPLRAQAFGLSTLHMRVRTHRAREARPTVARPALPTSEIFPPQRTE